MESIALYVDWRICGAFETDPIPGPRLTGALPTDPAPQSHQIVPHLSAALSTGREWGREEEGIKRSTSEGETLAVTAKLTVHLL